MPSPFAKYTGEQVQQINILPAVAQIGESLRKGISDLGAGAAAYIEGKRKHEEAGAMATSMLSKYIVSDPRDDSGNLRMIAENAPAHAVVALKKAQAIGKATSGLEDDFESGFSGLGAGDIRGYLSAEELHRDDQKTKFSQDLQTKGYQLQQAASALQQKIYDQGVATESQNYLFKVREFEWNSKRGATADEIAKGTFELAKIRAGLEEKLNPKQLELLSAQVLLAEQAGAKGKEEAELRKFDREARQAAGQVDPTVTTEELVPLPNGRITAGIVRSGELYDWTPDIDSYLQDLGLTREQVTNTSPLGSVEGGVPLFNKLAQKLSGDNDFNPNLPPTVNKSFKKTDFVRNVYDSLIAAYPDKKEVIDHQFKWNEQAGGNNKLVELNTERYNTAVKWLQAPSFQKHLQLKFGMESPVEVKTEAPRNVQIISEGETVQGFTTESVTMVKTNVRLWGEGYDKVAAEFKAANGRGAPMTKEEFYMSVGAWGGYHRYQVDSGDFMYVNPKDANGIPMTEAQFQGRVKARGGAQTTEQRVQNAMNQWLGSYGGKGKDIGGGIVVKFNAADESNPIASYKSASTNLGEPQEEARKAMGDITKVDGLIDEMKSLWEEMSPAWESTMGITPIMTEWEIKYKSKQRGLETFRKYIMATGTETEPDAQRLGDMMYQPNFSRKLNKALAPEVLEDTRRLIKDGAMRVLGEQGFTVSKKSETGKELNALMTDKERAQLILRIVQSQDPSYQTQNPLLKDSKNK